MSNVSHMKYLSVLVIANGELLTFEGLVFEDKLWLVPLWFEDKEQKASKPVRMIRFDNLPHEESKATAHDYIVHQPIPRPSLMVKRAKDMTPFGKTK